MRRLLAKARASHREREGTSKQGKFLNSYKRETWNCLWITSWRHIAKYPTLEILDAMAEQKSPRKRMTTTTTT
jgi:hypothetical protein